MSADLRARIADALTSWVLNASRSAEASRIVPIPETVHANSLLRADVVMTVVQPELDAKDAEIARLTAEFEDAESELGQLDDTQCELADARLERDHLRAADGRVRKALAKWDEDTVHDADALGFLLDDLRAALDQAPAAEQDGGGR